MSCTHNHVMHYHFAVSLFSVSVLMQIMHINVTYTSHTCSCQCPFHILYSVHIHGDIHIICYIQFISMYTFMTISIYIFMSGSVYISMSEFIYIFMSISVYISMSVLTFMFTYSCRYHSHYPQYH